MKKVIAETNPEEKLMLDLDITKDQLQIIQTITRSHPYFPELALDDFIFNNNLKSNPDISILIERGIITKYHKRLYLSKTLAKKYWDRIVHTIPVELTPTIDHKFLEDSPLENLKKAYTILTSLSPENLSKEKLIDEILTNMKGEHKMTNEKKPITPAMAAKENGISASAFRKMLRKLYGKTEGNWNLTQDKVDEVLKALESHKKEVAASRSERMAKLQEARKKAQAVKATAKPAATKKAPAKK